MVATNKYNYEEIRYQIIDALKNGAPASWSALARIVKLDSGTLRTAAKREWDVDDPKDLLGEALLPEPPKKLGTTVTEEGNTLEIDHVAGMVTSLDDALRASNTDLSAWIVRDHQINFWPMGMKIKDSDGNEQPYAMQLCQVKVWLIRKDLKPLMPVIAPVEIIFSTDVRKEARAGKIPRLKQGPEHGRERSDGLKRALILADPQVGFRRRLHTSELVPFHDRRVLDLALQISHDVPFDSLEIIGDTLDLSEWSSKFNPEPEFYWTTQPALVEWAWWLAQFPQGVKRLSEGNHEKRMRDLVAIYAKAAYGLRAVDELHLPPALSVDRLMAFHKLGVQYLTGYPDNKYWLNKNVLILHGDVVRSGPGDTAKAMVNKTTYTSVFGHIHRRELVSRRIKSRDGDVIQTAFCPGCACHIDGRVPGSKSDDQWQQGLAEIEYTDDFEIITPIPVENGRAIYRGKIFTARADIDRDVDAMIRSKLVPNA
jgi:hypothetical protein